MSAQTRVPSAGSIIPTRGCEYQCIINVLNDNGNEDSVTDSDYIMKIDIQDKNDAELILDILPPPSYLPSFGIVITGGGAKSIKFQELAAGSARFNVTILSVFHHILPL